MDERWYTVYATKNNRTRKLIWVKATCKDEVRRIAAEKDWFIDSYNGAVVRQDCDPRKSDTVVG